MTVVEKDATRTKDPVLVDVAWDPIDAADERARTSEPQGYCPADPAASAGDQRDTTGQ